MEEYHVLEEYRAAGEDFWALLWLTSQGHEGDLREFHETFMNLITKPSLMIFRDFLIMGDFFRDHDHDHVITGVFLVKFGGVHE